MAKEKQSITPEAEKASKKPRSFPIAERGITNTRQFAELMSALMTDLICGAIAPEVGNAACNASGKLLKAVELQYKYGKQEADGERVLELVRTSNHAQH